MIMEYEFISLLFRNRVEIQAIPHEKNYAILIVYGGIAVSPVNLLYEK
jgi:hypothetical protein